MHNSAISTSISNQRYQSPSPTNSMDSFIPLLTIGCSNRPYVILRIFPSVLQKIPDRRMVVRVIPSRVNSILKIICINIHIIFRRTWRCSENYCSVFQTSQCVRISMGINISSTMELICGNFFFTNLISVLEKIA